MAHDRAAGRDDLTADEAAQALLNKWASDEEKKRREGEPLDIDLCVKGAEEAAEKAHLDIAPIDD